MGKRTLKNSLDQYPIGVAVRNGRCGTCPKVLTRFINECRAAGESMDRRQRRLLYMDVLNIMMETVCDSLVDRCWRGWCLDNVYLPLGYLRSLSQSEQESRECAKIEANIRLLSHYFLS